MIKMLQDKSFANRINCRYFDLRENILSEEHLFHFMDSVALLVENAQKRHFNKYQILGKNVGAPEVDEQPDTYTGEVKKLKSWISTRLNWLDEYMVGNCGGSIDEVDEILSIYPNPANGIIHLNSVKDFKEIEIYNTMGKLCFKKNIYSKEEISINISALQAGMYLIRVGFTDGNIASGKFTVY